MRRDYFTLEVIDAGWVDTDGSPTMPKLEISYEGPRETLTFDFLKTDGELPPAAAVDVSLRLQDTIEDPESQGVLSLSDRLTGDLFFEMNVHVDPMLDFIRAARRYGETVSDAAGRYTVTIHVGDEHHLTFDKRTLLVYNSEGNLLRQHSIIPSGVEL